MKKQAENVSIVNSIKQFLTRVGKQVFDDNKSIRYLDYNNIPRRLTRKKLI